MPLLVMAFAAGAPQRRSHEDLIGQLLLLVQAFAPVAYPFRDGRGKERVRSGVRTAAVISVILSVCVTVIMLIAGKYLLQMFIDASEVGAAESLQIGFHYLIIASDGLVSLY